jgi:hypothetical protein
MFTVHSNPFILLRKKIGIYCKNHTKQKSGLSVRACLRVCMRDKMQISLILQQVLQAAVAYPGIFSGGVFARNLFGCGGGGSTNSVEDRGQR